MRVDQRRRKTRKSPDPCHDLIDKPPRAAAHLSPKRARLVKFCAPRPNSSTSPASRSMRRVSVVRTRVLVRLRRSLRRCIRPSPRLLLAPTDARPAAACVACSTDSDTTVSPCSLEKRAIRCPTEEPSSPKALLSFNPHSNSAHPAPAAATQLVMPRRRHLRPARTCERHRGNPSRRDGPVHRDDR